MRAGVLQNEDVVRPNIEVRIVDTPCEILQAREHDGPALGLEQSGRCGRAFDDRALRREVASQRDQAAFARDRSVERMDDRAVNPVQRLVQALAQRDALTSIVSR